MTTSHTDTRPDTFEFFVSRQACDVIKACQERVERLGEYFGYDSPQYLKAAQSWSRQLTRLISSPILQTTRVYADGPLSLVSNSGITFGLNFHPVKRKCVHEGCDYYLHEDGHAYHFGLTADARSCGDHVPDLPIEAPTPGDWTFNS